MAKKEFTFKGKSIEELKEMDLKDFSKMLPSRQRRTIERDFTEKNQRLLNKVKLASEGKFKKDIKTHLRDMIVVPNMVGLRIHVHDGRKFVSIEILPEMIGKYLGEFAGTRGRVSHSAPGIGATKSSSAASVK